MWLSLEEFFIFPFLSLPSLPLTLLTFLLSLLWYMVLVSIMILCLYALQSNHHNKSLSICLYT